MSFADWKNVIGQLEEYRKKTGENICITIWGGEPLISPYFDDLLVLVKQRGFETEVITNGFFIDQHKTVIENYADRLYISLDGTEEIHDEIRGTGVFKKIVGNLRELNHRNIIIMSVISEKLIHNLQVFFTELDNLNIKSLFLQELICFDVTEIAAYKKWMKNTFGVEAKDIDSWQGTDKRSFSDALKMILQGEKKYHYHIEHKIHTSNKDIFCVSPFRHMHITWNGAVTYCTDFYDFTAGNVKDSSVEEIFFNELSEKYCESVKQGNCVLCNHCSWRNRKAEEY